MPRHLTAEEFKNPAGSNCQGIVNPRQLTAERYYDHLMVFFSLITCVNNNFLICYMVLGSLRSSNAFSSFLLELG